MIKSALATLAVAVMAMFLSACATTALPPGNAPAITAEGYQLGAGDKVRVTVFNEPNLSGEFTVSGTGTIEIPLAGSVPAKGNTPEQLQSAIQTMLASGGFVLNPRVSAEVIEYRPYYILGEVSEPGQYPFLIGLTVSKAVATAGGFTYRANTRDVFITRDGEQVEQRVQLTAATPIGPGDQIRIGERAF